MLLVLPSSCDTPSQVLHSPWGVVRGEPPADWAEMIWGFWETQYAENGLVGWFSWTVRMNSWGLGPLSTEQGRAWCHRRCTAFRQRLCSQVPTLLVTSWWILRKISSLLWVSSVKWRIWRGWFFSAPWLWGLKGKWLRYAWDQRKNFLPVCYEEGEIDLLTFVWFGKDEIW